jgi:septal ring factor EnvC (AmiA/AmiB activator)
MTDSNIISLAITLFGIAAGSLFNNVRISDLANATNKRFDDMRDFIRSENARIDQKLDRIADTLSAMLSDHEQRIRAIEQQRPH